MKILLINYTDAGGGAAIAALRLVSALNEHGINARLGVKEKRTSSPYVFELPKKKQNIFLRKASKAFFYFSKIFAPCTKSFKPRFITSNRIIHYTNYKSKTDINCINDSDFDIINLHWIIDTISIKDISKIKKPIVWTMHDSWPCCGAEHHPNFFENDTRWKTGYYPNNKPKSTKGIDLCRKVWLQKKKYLIGKEIFFTTPSRWEADILSSSSLFSKCNCQIIPNLIPEKVFYPRNKKAAREMYNIPNDKIIIGFGAAYDIDDPKSMKGSFYLLETLKQLKNPEKFFLVVFGPAGDAFTSEISIPFFASGYISNFNILASLYSVCDIVVNPSLIENLPTICLEALFCGIPSVAFDVGGTSDIVKHKKTGFLATPFKPEELAQGIEWCTKNLTELSDNCLKKAKTDFCEENIIKEMLNCYKSCIE